MKIFLVDDHQLFREGVALLLRRLADNLDLVEASNCEEALALFDDHPDIELILLDLHLNGMYGLDGLVMFRERYPGIPVVVLSSMDDEATVRLAIERGAMGFIPKNSSSEIMLNALRLVLAKGVYLPRTVLSADPPSSFRQAVPKGGSSGNATSLTPADLGLTPRQSEVLYCVLQGKSIKLICRQLDLSEGTVKGHVSAVLRALNVTTRTQAIVAAHKLGLRF